MSDFREAQQLFDKYMDQGRIQYLKESVELLKDIIQSDGADTSKALHLKKRIQAQVDMEMEGLLEKYNVRSFASIQRPYTEGSFFDLLLNDFTEADRIKFCDFLLLASESVTSRVVEIMFGKSKKNSAHHST